MSKHTLIAAGLVTGALFALSGAALASDDFKHIPAATVANDVKDTSKGPASKIYFTNANFIEMIANRTASGQVELHTHWNDYITVLDGEATLTVGGTPVGMKDTKPGEQLGDSITGGQTVAMKVGDMVTIPAGLPHQLKLAPGAHFRYLVIKTRE